MNKNAIQKYAIWARRELIEQIKQRAYQYGITEKGYGDENATVIAGRALTQEEIRQRREFVVQIKKYGFDQAIEEVAYTWFNRFIALRFMEVNDYLPTHVRVFSDSNGNFNPEILRDVLHLDLPGLDKAKVSELLNANKTEELYRYLLLTQCNALNEALPEMFEKLGSYTEMLLPNNILKPDGIIGRLVTDIPEEDWKDAVQIIGWMYQYYNTEPKQAVFDGLKKNIKITKEKIPAATQLFTPDWIVRYMVENSLGRLWLEQLETQKAFDFNYIDFDNFSWGEDKDKSITKKQESLKSKWKYYIEEAEQSDEVKKQLYDLRMKNKNHDITKIKVLDPCMGSGHILVYAFDVLMQIYESEGHNPRDAAKLILENNLYGMDIDRRACQLAYFALMMKARQYNRRIFNEGVKPQVYHPVGWSEGEEYGSLIKVDELLPKPERFLADGETYDPNYEKELRIWNFKRLLSQKYDVVVTNPPYMGSSGMGPKLSEFVKNNYPDSKSDLFAVFIEKCGELLKPIGYQAMITQHAWMFLSSYEKLRNKLFNRDIVNMVHLGARAFEEIGGEVVQTTAFVLSKRNIADFAATYIRLVDYNNQHSKEVAFLSGSDRKVARKTNFKKIPGCPIAYWISNELENAFIIGKPITEYIDTFLGIITGDNEKFLRLWSELDSTRIPFYADNMDTIDLTKQYWIPYNKGGEFRRWYGIQDYVIFWKYGPDDKRRGKRDYSKYYLRDYIAWSYTVSTNTKVIATRYYPRGFLWDVRGSGIFDKSNNLYYLAALISSKVGYTLFRIKSEVLSCQVENIEEIPVILDEEKHDEVDKTVKDCIELSRADWDSFETSWDFKRHPMIYNEETITSSYNKWKHETEKRFFSLQANEEKLNRIFINIYSLQDELTPEVEDKDVTVYRIFDNKEEIPESMAGSKYALTKQDAIKTFISYAVGCMFGRYSLDIEGLAFAGGEWDDNKYKTFIPDRDNIIPICDDEYFEDDIVGRFVEFVRVVYGDETLEDNLKFIADALGGKGTPREVIRNYFLNDFYKDHCKTYQKRPIYWLFDSGKKNGFKALIYMHRYSRDLLAKLRTDYVHEQQERYRTQLSHIAAALDKATGAERARLIKQESKLTEQLHEISVFEEKVHHLADQYIEIDLDDGVKHNYQIFADVLAKI